MNPIVDDPVIAVYRQHVDRSLLRENLKLTPEQRLMKLQSFLAFSEELRRAGARTLGETSQRRARGVE
jgi:hypothetical protein